MNILFHKLSSCIQLQVRANRSLKHTLRQIPSGRNQIRQMTWLCARVRVRVRVCVSERLRRDWAQTHSVSSLISSTLPVWIKACAIKSLPYIMGGTEDLRRKYHSAFQRWPHSSQIKTNVSSVNEDVWECCITLCYGKCPKYYFGLLFGTFICKSLQIDWRCDQPSFISCLIH